MGASSLHNYWKHGEDVQSDQCLDYVRMFLALHHSLAVMKTLLNEGTGPENWSPAIYRDTSSLYWPLTYISEYLQRIDWQYFSEADKNAPIFQTLKSQGEYCRLFVHLHKAGRLILQLPNCIDNMPSVKRTVDATRRRILTNATEISAITSVIGH